MCFLGGWYTVLIYLVLIEKMRFSVCWRQGKEKECRNWLGTRPSSWNKPAMLMPN